MRGVRVLLVAVEYMCFMSVASSSEVFGLSGYYSSPSNQDCSVTIEYSSPTGHDDSSRDKDTGDKKKKNKDRGGEGRRVGVFLSYPGDGHTQCFFNGTDARRAPLPGVVHVTSEGEATITCDFSSIGGVSARRGVFNQTVWPRQLIWEAETPTSSSTKAAKLSEEEIWLRLPFTGYYSDSRFPKCRRQIYAETLTSAKLQGSDAHTLVNGCNGYADVLWHNNQEIHLRGDRITIHYSRRYSFSQEIWDEMRKLKREEANSINGRDADDSLGNWWDEEGMESGSLQRENGNILWDDGSLWVRHDGRLHDKSYTGSAVGGQETTSVEDVASHHNHPLASQQNVDRSNRRHKKVEEMREKAARHSNPSKSKKQKYPKNPKSETTVKPQRDKATTKNEKEESWKGLDSGVDKVAQQEL